MTRRKVAETEAVTYYGTKSDPRPKNPPMVNKVSLKKYCDHGFMETPQFWDDLIEVGGKIAQTPLA